MTSQLSPVEAFLDRLKALGRGVLMLDYDGTLAPFRVQREMAYPYPGISERLSLLAAAKHIRTIIVSGRAIDDLRRLLQHVHPLPELWGSHGLERLQTDGAYVKVVASPEAAHALQEAERACVRLAGRARCERKPFGIAFHWRGMEQLSIHAIEEPLLKAWGEIAQASDVAVYPFDGGLEIRVKDKGKADVVNTILQETGERAAIAYLGDDVADESAFAVLKDHGLKVLVRKEHRPTLADVCFSKPSEVLEFLDRCLRQVQ